MPACLLAALISRKARQAFKLLGPRPLSRQSLLLKMTRCSREGDRFCNFLKCPPASAWRRDALDV